MKYFKPQHTDFIRDISLNAACFATAQKACKFELRRQFYFLNYEVSL